MGCVGRVVACDAINRAVLKALLEQFNVHLGSQRWLHLKLSVEFANVIFGKDEVHRTDFAGYRCAEGLNQSNNFDGSPCANPHDMHGTTCVKGQQAVAHRRDFLGGSRNAFESKHRTDCTFVHRSALAKVCVIGVHQDRKANLVAKDHRSGHDLGILDRKAFIASGNDSRSFH